MTPAGLNAFASRRESKSGVYSFEQQNVSLSGLYLAALRKNKKAFAQFEAQPPSYRKKAAWWIMSAKKEETRRARLEKLIAECLKSAAPKSANSAARSQGRT